MMTMTHRRGPTLSRLAALFAGCLVAALVAAGPSPVGPAFAEGEADADDIGPEIGPEIGLDIAEPAAASWPETLEGHGGPIGAIAVSSDGTRAVSASFDYSAIVWDMETGAPLLRLLGHDAAVNDVAFAGGDDGLIVSVSDDGTFAVWDVATGEMAARFRGEGDKMVDVTVSSDGRLAAVAGWDLAARVYDLDAGAEVAVMDDHGGNVNSVAFSPDGTTLYSGAYDGAIRQWDVATGDLESTLYRHGWGINVVVAMPEPGHLAFGALNGESGLIDVDAGEIVLDFATHDGPVLIGALQEQEGLVAFGSADGHVRVYRMADWSMIHDYSNPLGPVWGLGFTPDGRVLYFAGLDDTAFAWRISPRLPFEPPAGAFPRRFQISDTADLGERQFARKCSVCHTLTPDDANRAGPTLYGIFGREAGTLPGYPYSEALLESDIVWTAETIGRLFDDGPDVVTPGTKMPIQRLKDAEERDALIAFLKRTTMPRDEANTN